MVEVGVDVAPESNLCSALGESQIQSLEGVSRREDNLGTGVLSEPKHDTFKIQHQNRQLYSEGEFILSSSLV